MSDDRPRPSEPAVPVDVIADLHAGVLPEEEARAVRARVDADPTSRQVFAALDATVDDLRGAPVVPQEPPPAVAAAIDATLRALRDDDARVVDLDTARDARRRRGLLVAAAVAVVVAVATGVIAVSTATRPTDDSVRAEPTPTTDVPSDPRGASPVSLLSVVGRTDPALGDPTDPSSRLRGCLAANNVPASVAVVGAGPVVVDGRRRIVVLLTTGVAGRFDALVVGSDCSAGRPSSVSRQVIGATPPTR